MTRRALSVDVAIVGGGISGLWIANLLVQRGLSIAVCEPGGVGGTQTLASQGIVHGGAKYSLGDTTPLSRALKAMPDRWRACLQGAGEIDLRGVGVLAEKMHFHLGGETRELDELVLDVASLVRRLAEPIKHRVIAAEVSAKSLVPGQNGIERIELDTHVVHARVHVFAAGVGNQALARQAGFASAVLRQRPLRQTIVRLRRRAGIFAHWTANEHDAEPTLTVTSHGRVLSVGGQVADAGTHRSEVTPYRRGKRDAPAGVPRRRCRKRRIPDFRCGTCRARGGRHPSHFRRLRNALRELPALPAGEA